MRLSDFVERDRERIGRLAWRLTCGDSAAAEAAARATFTRAYRSFRRLEDSPDLAARYYRTLVHRAGRLAARGQRGAPGRTTLADPGANGDLRPQIARALRGLPRDQRESFVLIQLEGFTAGEAAELLGKSPDAIERSLRGALAALAAELGPLVPGGEALEELDVGADGVELSPAAASFVKLIAEQFHPAAGELDVGSGSRGRPDPGRLVRLSVASAAAAGVTFGLFFVMHSLIAMGLRGESTETESEQVEILRSERDSELRTKRRLPKRTQAQDRPQPPPMKLAKTLRPQPATNMTGLAFTPEIEMMGADSGLGVLTSDQDVMPIVRVPPQYPFRAADLGMEGWVLLEFTITKTGAVTDVIVVDAEPTSLFNREAIRAVRKWKYKPKIEGGVPVERHGVRTVITFELDE